MAVSATTTPTPTHGGERGSWWSGIRMLVVWVLHPFPENRIDKGREVFAGLRDLLLLVILVAWWVGLSEHKKHRPWGLIALLYVLPRWKWCTAPYGTRVLAAAPADTAPAPADVPPPSARRAQCLAPSIAVTPSFAL
ncbi:hypothetical protein L202_07619 [Cryptococcus amylolentus CBS 6039]|uniref:Uncharacterized protein n=1 Tax=Cryptococcus amylolentus CBS 6039 TaxID=1295533 RepID=A0A1E3HCU7_9TREE|nr:hypothetical protein L202_07619 [Cryptococcus amylolentus CBS 6039]ODN74167.1 hypothetical protein L202_07619 [Cryptococcus amylolentus CBS 6039]